MKKLFAISLASLLGMAIVIVPSGGAARAAVMPPTAISSSNGITLELNAQSEGVWISASSTNPTDTLRISKQGQPLEVFLASGQLVDRNVTQGEDVTYSVEVVSKATVANAIDAGLASTTFKSNSLLNDYVNFDIVAATVGVPYADAFTLVGLPQVASAATVDKTLFRYQTFIPAAKTEAKGCYSIQYKDQNATDYFYKGDNRGFDPTPATSRTKHDVTADWNSGGNLTGYKAVGWSHLLVYKNSTLLADHMLKAGSENMTATVTYESSTASAFHMRNDTHNPFCELANGIFYDIDVVLHRNGSYSVSGTALNAPNHEIWLQDVGTGTWSPVHLKTGNMDCLFPIINGLIFSCDVAVANSGIF